MFKLLTFHSQTQQSLGGISFSELWAQVPPKSSSQFCSSLQGGEGNGLQKALQAVELSTVWL